MAGKQVDLGIKLGRIEGPDKRKEGETLKKTTVVTSSAGGKKATKVYAQPPMQYQQLIYYSAPPLAHNIMLLLLLKYNKTARRLVEFLNRRSKPPPSRFSEAMQRKPASANSSLPCRCHSLRFTGSSSQAVRIYRWHLLPTSTEKRKTKTCIIKDMIEKNQISFNAVKPPNVQANPLPDHGSSSSPTINMIGAYFLGKK
ncbi:hypothetical protein CRG98_004426 [Punica granatum]|uniref:Uncharacterized protein n=1 Tax=Punica granatum TaxID=22663 RepID=A0A2I0L3D3_PUNGR|nr:hypothetical protein CRG98_004426 [Punica granatum]